MAEPEVHVLDHKPTLEEAQRLVGGYVELLLIENGEAQMLVNEDGLSKHLPRNMGASALARRTIVGDVVVLRGDTCWGPSEE